MNLMKIRLKIVIEKKSITIDDFGKQKLKMFIQKIEI